ncbi:MAG: hypothetical protein GY737_01500 [Desulfobacteraceae bacterium]|nr:hypothetical protein [Desulfobacteraceae bacterium]
MVDLYTHLMRRHLVEGMQLFSEEDPFEKVTRSDWCGDVIAILMEMYDVDESTGDYKEWSDFADVPF